MVWIANHPIPHDICSGIGTDRDVLTVCAVLGQAVLHGATAGHTARSNQRLLLSGIGQIFLRRGSGDRFGRDVGLVHLDGHSSGHSRVFWCIRRKRPFGFIAVICSWRDCAILPCECAVDGCAGVGVFHRACDGARAQLVAIGNLACGDFAVRHGLDLVHCVEIERQIEDLVVIRGDINRDRSDLAGFPAVLCIDRQRQNTAVDPHLEGIDCIPGFKVGRRFATIEYRAIGSIRRGGQNLLGIIGVFQRRAVDHVQRAGLDTRGRSGFGDGEPVRIIGRENVADLCGTFRLTFKHIVFACERHGEGKRLSASDLRRGQITPVRLLTGKLGVREGERRIGKFNLRRFAEERQLVRSERDICTAVVGLGD